MASGPAKVKTPTTAEQAKEYSVVGLKESDHMPVQYAGRTFNLANLTPEEARLLASATPWIVI